MKTTTPPIPWGPFLGLLFAAPTYVTIDAVRESTGRTLLPRTVQVARRRHLDALELSAAGNAKAAAPLPGHVDDPGRVFIDALQAADAGRTLPLASDVAHILRRYPYLLLAACDDLLRRRRSRGAWATSSVHSSAQRGELRDIRTRVIADLAP